MAIDIEEEIRTALPGSDEIVVQYVAGYLADEEDYDEDALELTRTFLESFAQGREAALDRLIERLGDLLAEKLSVNKKTAPTLLRLDRVLDMSKTGGMSTTITMGEGVDLESVNKAKCVSFVTINDTQYQRLVQSLPCGHEETREGRSKTQSQDREAFPTRSLRRIKTYRCAKEAAELRRDVYEGVIVRWLGCRRV